MPETKTPSEAKTSDKSQAKTKTIEHAKGKLAKGFVLMVYVGTVEAFSPTLGHNVNPDIVYCAPACRAFAMAFREAGKQSPVWRPFREEDAKLIELYGRECAVSEPPAAGN